MGILIRHSTYFLQFDGYGCRPFEVLHLMCVSEKTPVISKSSTAKSNLFIFNEKSEQFSSNLLITFQHPDVFTKWVLLFTCTMIDVV